MRDLREVLQAWGEDPALPGETEPYARPWVPPLTGAEQAEATVLAFAADPDADEPHWAFDASLASLVRLGHSTPPVREALARLRASDRRLSGYGDYRAFLEDEKIRERIDAVLALP
ncbi:hypothetical protein F0344_00565 [Streptomyces finlayi]|uniref:Uncharacterized protein n=1 Tax=Streptomyces finlayi TaxID=67296 RepID=A0A7G7BDA0_9ACTN|nr:hypothetical protein [Streptomyces finlayi]QNE73315.1 hypothetical protein F0344_00565 [Streptomyces finlayi]